MFQNISGDGMPEVEQDRSTLLPSISVTLDGLTVTMGTSKYKQGGGYRRRDRGRKKRERSIHGQMFSFEMKHKTRVNLDKRGRASTHTHTHTHDQGGRKERRTKKDLEFSLPSLPLSLSLPLSFKQTRPNQTVTQREGPNTAMAALITGACLQCSID